MITVMMKREENHRLCVISIYDRKHDSRVAFPLSKFLRNETQRTIMKDDYQIFRFDEFQIIDVDVVMPNLESK